MNRIMRAALTSFEKGWTFPLSAIGTLHCSWSMLMVYEAGWLTSHASPIPVAKVLACQC